jgi:hypothetical protein
MKELKGMFEGAERKKNASSIKNNFNRTGDTQNII